MIHNNFSNMASTYGSGTYDSTTYNGQTTTNTGGTSSPPPSGGGTSGVLTDTGLVIAGIVTLSCIILLTAIVVRVWKRPSRPQSTE